MQINGLALGLIIIYACSVAILLTVCDNNKSKKYYVPIKTACSAEFLIIAICLAVKNNSFEYFSLLITSLILCFAGDFVLGVANVAISHRKRLLFYGMLSFFAAHIFFLLLFYSIDSQFSAWLILGPILMVVLATFLGYKLHFKMGRLRIPATLYSLMISLIMFKAIAIGIDATISKSSLLAIGGAMFFVSDMLESVMLFYHFKEQKYKLIVHIFNLVLYYFAILNLILSLI